MTEFRRVLRPGGRLIAVLHERTFLLNYPEPTGPQSRLEQVVAGFADLQLSCKLPIMLRQAGFTEIAVEIELDPIYTAIGRIGHAQRRNAWEILQAGKPRIAETLGGMQEAEAFLHDLFAWLDDPNKCTYSQIWMVSGAVPN